MKLITAIVRMEQVDDVIAAVIRGGARGMTVTDTRGFGRQHGHSVTGLGAGGADGEAVLLPMARLDVIAWDRDIDGLVNCVAAHAHTGEIGDGRSGSPRSSRSCVSAPVNGTPPPSDPRISRAGLPAAGAPVAENPWAVRLGLA